MNLAQKSALVSRANERRGAISDEKGPEYTGAAASYKAKDANILTNFYVRAERAKASVFTIAQTYAGKHIDSIETALSELAKCGSIAARVTAVRKGEGLISRLDDLRNYCDLLECILMEEGIHPEKLDMQQLADYELREEAESIDWSRPGYVKKVEGDDERFMCARYRIYTDMSGCCGDPGDCTRRSCE